MKITFTNKAIAKLLETVNNEQDCYVKLKYDTEGCGCTVSGIASLWIVKDIDDEDLRIKTNFLPVYVEKSEWIFFDEDMKIDFHESAHTYMLMSPQQVLNPRMSCVVK
ncbi:iron-sulfur cluster biosynthesis family protein [Bacillus alveayuensis]|jgi:uncharacterized protein YqkB|uniref:iron-sulfur cluster biosynthesis family protein n=1 Tax=Aeribacillus alveayuensis TaxID=279215 RepID=UPI0005D0F9B5|nr:iron-sulfur cluster biosynthesis family protein [Bacillus alveayuensis]